MGVGVVGFEIGLCYVDFVVYFQYVGLVFVLQVMWNYMDLVQIGSDIFVGGIIFMGSVLDELVVFVVQVDCQVVQFWFG